jgi:hypothetical protein
MRRKRIKTGRPLASVVRWSPVFASGRWACALRVSEHPGNPHAGLRLLGPDRGGQRGSGRSVARLVLKPARYFISRISAGLVRRRTGSPAEQRPHRPVRRRSAATKLAAAHDLSSAGASPEIGLGLRPASTTIRRRIRHRQCMEKPHDLGWLPRARQGLRALEFSLPLPACMEPDLTQVLGADMTRAPPVVTLGDPELSDRGEGDGRQAEK